MGDAGLSKETQRDIAGALRKHNKTFREISLALAVSESSARKLFIEWQLQNNEPPMEFKIRQERCRIMRNQRLEKISTMQSEGASLGEIAKALGINKSRVAHIIWQKRSKESIAA